MRLDDARREFKRAYNNLASHGLKALNPMEHPPMCGGDCQGDKQRRNDMHARQCYLRWDLVLMITYCDGVALLDGWERSLGAKAEKQIAEHCGMPAKPIRAWIRGCGVNA
jgi:hypothetical protein